MDTAPLQVYITGPDSIIHHLYLHDGGATWAEKDMGGPAIYEARAVSWDINYMRLFINTTNGNILEKAYTSTDWWTPYLIAYNNLEGIGLTAVASR
ncbi:hypothetical protein M422DRAFT_272100 [Sphaerobolus stellatus SS14]|uniref:Fucose-specific lectin n=1 Tax=Sphaerobolus stellatus (strain SS14) TaxID=990650 RepID=A0A0C9UCF0_SPHS4|nr:hypothetical protein M422DRAFT_272100 [Sphaerobolus stellatus SS14]